MRGIEVHGLRRGVGSVDHEPPLSFQERVSSCRQWIAIESSAHLALGAGAGPVRQRHEWQDRGAREEACQPPPKG